MKTSISPDPNDQIYKKDAPQGTVKLYKLNFSKAGFLGMYDKNFFLKLDRSVSLILESGFINNKINKFSKVRTRSPGMYC